MTNLCRSWIHCNRPAETRNLTSLRVSIILLSVLSAGAGRAASGSDAREQAGAPPQAELLQRLRQSRTPYHSFATRFTQRKRLAMLDVTLDSEGMIFYSRPGSVRFEILSPVRSLMLYDGKKVRCYSFTDGTWKLLNNPAATAIGQILRQIGRWIQGDFDADRKMFDLDVVPADTGLGSQPQNNTVGGPAGCIRLTPRDKALAKYIQRIEIYVAKAPEYQVTRVLIRESDVDLTDMRFRQELRNPALPEGTYATPEASNACLGLFPRENPSDPNEAKKSKP